MPKLIMQHRQFLLFLGVGVLSALIDVGLMQLLIVGGCNVIVATSVGFATGLVVNYTLHARVTFQSPFTPHGFARFMCLVGVNYLFTLACVGLSMHLIGIAVVGKLVSLPLIAVNGFLIGKRWIFK